MAELSGTAGDRVRGLRVVVASANPGVRAWARESFPADVTLRAVVDDVSVAADLLRAERADACLLDLRLAGGAVAAMSAFREAAHPARIVAWAARDDEPGLVEAVDAGAAGCIVGRPGGDAIARTFADVMAGRPALPRAVVARLVAQLRQA